MWEDIWWAGTERKGLVRNKEENTYKNIHVPFNGNRTQHNIYYWYILHKLQSKTVAYYVQQISQTHFQTLVINKSIIYVRALVVILQQSDRGESLSKS